MSYENTVDEYGNELGRGNEESDDDTDNEYWGGYSYGLGHISYDHETVTWLQINVFCRKPNLKS